MSCGANRECKTNPIGLSYCINSFGTKQETTEAQSDITVLTRKVDNLESNVGTASITGNVLWSYVEALLARTTALETELCTLKPASSFCSTPACVGTGSQAICDSYDTGISGECPNAASMITGTFSDVDVGKICCSTGCIA